MTERDIEAELHRIDVALERLHRTLVKSTSDRERLLARRQELIERKRKEVK